MHSPNVEISMVEDKHYFACKSKKPCFTWNVVNNDVFFATGCDNTSGDHSSNTNRGLPGGASYLCLFWDSESVCDHFKAVDAP